MIDLKGIKHIYIYPGITDMRLGINGLRQKILTIENVIEINSLYLFCSKQKHHIKAIEVASNSIWLYQNKMIKGKFAWPDKGDKFELTDEELKMILNCMSLISSIENKGESFAPF